MSCGPTTAARSASRRWKFFGALHDAEREAPDADSQARLGARRRSRPVTDALNPWMRQEREETPDGSSTARAVDDNPNRWVAPTRFLGEGDLPIATTQWRAASGRSHSAGLARGALRCPFTPSASNQADVRDVEGEWV
ncbi:IS66 family transposase [Rubrivivax sp. RP6-9]|uniref:IS66 family transposase n=1 Tax=Rubrivivax sp. RP6-9 TaxID=3415750 RepID=UPI003CC59168